MNYIEEKIKVFAPVNIIWKIWSDNYIKTGFEIGKKGHVMADKKKKVKYQIKDFKENESLTVVWFSFLVKLIFFHHVKAIDNGSLITCRVNLEGFLSFLIKPLIANKIRKYLRVSLEQFSRNLANL